MKKSFNADDTINYEDNAEIHISSHKTTKIIRGAVAHQIESAEGNIGALRFYWTGSELPKQIKTGCLRAMGPTTAAVRLSSAIDDGYKIIEHCDDEWTATLLFGEAEDRIRFLFSKLVQCFSDFRVLPVKLSYPRISSIVGVNEKSVERTISRWIKQEIICRHPEGYEILGFKDHGT